MICHVPELGDEAPVIDGLADVVVTKEYFGTLTAEVWEIRPHVLLISSTPLHGKFQVSPGYNLKISLAPHLLKR